MKKKIIIYAVTRSDNLGDNVIGETFFKLVKAKYPSYCIVLRDLYHLPFIFKVLLKFLNIIHINTTGLRVRLMRATEFFSLRHREQIVVFAGGQLFYEAFIEQISEILNLADAKGINVHFYGCGTGYIPKEKLTKFIQLLSNPNVKSICLRDDYIGLESLLPKIRFVPDVAVCCNRVYKRKKNRCVVGVGLISIYNYNKHNIKQISKIEYYNSIINLINYLIERSYSVELFCNGNDADYDACKELYNQIKGSRLSIAPRPKTATDLVNIITQYSHVVASRLHAMIISYSFDIPFYGISWDLKIPAFCDNIDYPNYCGLELLDYTYNTIQEQLLHSSYNEDLRGQLQHRVIKEIENIIC